MIDSRLSYALRDNIDIPATKELLTTCVSHESETRAARPLLKAYCDKVKEKRTIFASCLLFPRLGKESWEANIDCKLLLKDGQALSYENFRTFGTQ